jgi:hypothetical protein
VAAEEVERHEGERVWMTLHDGESLRGMLAEKTADSLVVAEGARAMAAPPERSERRAVARGSIARVESERWLYGWIGLGVGFAADLVGSYFLLRGLSDQRDYGF